MENDLVKRLIISGIEIIKDQYEKKSEQRGSLYNLFGSEMFDMHYTLYYLDLREEPGVVDTLVNEMYNRFINQSFFYLPQIWYIIQ